MFVNKLKMDAIAEAVKKCMDEADLEETGLRKAAYAAHTKGEKMFSFKGKTYPVKVQGEEVSYGKEIKEASCEDEVKKHEKRLHGKDGEVSKHVDKMHKEELSHKQKKIAKLNHPKDEIDAGDLSKLRGEETELDEADKVATSTGMKVYGSSYGDSAKARRDQLKRPVDDTKGPNKSELSQMAKVKKEEFFKDRLITNYIEEEAQFEAELQEVLSKDATAGDYISDFVHSDNPKFAGKSVKKRQKMALAAYYAKQRNESVDDSYPVTTDTVAGRMPGGMSNTFKQFKLRVRAKDKEAAETLNQVRNSNPMELSAKEPHLGHGGLVSIPPAGVVRKEEVEHIEETKGAQAMKSSGVKQSPDKLLARTGMNMAHKFPRKGQTNLGNIPGINTPGVSKDTADYAEKRRGDREKQLKPAIKAALGTHGPKGKLPEEVELDEKEGYGGSDPLANRASYAKKHGTGQVYKKTYPGDKVGMTRAHAYDIKRAGPKGKLPEEVELNEVSKSEVEHHFHNWTNSEHAPYNSDAGDDNKVHQSALSYLKSTNVPKEDHEKMAMHIAHKFHGSGIYESTPPKNTDVADKSYLKDMGKKPTVKSDLKNFKNFLTGKKETNESLDEAASRKDFQMVADLIKTHDNHDKRKELATHHAEIFHRQNPRFDRSKFMKAANVNEGKQPETDNVPFVTNADQPPFDGPYKKIDKTTTDKSGAKHTPMSRARDLAQAAMKRVKTEMLGKAPGNNG
jgi:hypothetical protein